MILSSFQSLNFVQLIQPLTRFLTIALNRIAMTPLMAIYSAKFLGSQLISRTFQIGRNDCIVNNEDLMIQFLKLEILKKAHFAYFQYQFF